MLGRLGLAIFLISRRWTGVNFGGWPPLYFGYSESNPSVLKFRITSRTRSPLVKATLAIAGASMPCADSSTICARRQVTTDSLPRRMIRTRRLPSSSSISRTRSRSLTKPFWRIKRLEGKPGRGGPACYGTSSRTLASGRKFMFDTRLCPSLPGLTPGRRLQGAVQPASQAACLGDLFSVP